MIFFAFLRQYGCDEVQGFLFSKPVAAEACAALIDDPTWLRGLLGAR